MSDEETTEHSLPESFLAKTLPEWLALVKRKLSRIRTSCYVGAACGVLVALWAHFGLSRAGIADFFGTDPTIAVAKAPNYSVGKKLDGSSASWLPDNVLVDIYILRDYSLFNSPRAEIEQENTLRDYLVEELLQFAEGVPKPELRRTACLGFARDMNPSQITPSMPRKDCDDKLERSENIDHVGFDYYHETNLAGALRLVLESLEDESMPTELGNRASSESHGYGHTDLIFIISDGIHDTERHNEYCAQDNQLLLSEEIRSVLTEMQSKFSESKGREIRAYLLMTNRQNDCLADNKELWINEVASQFPWFHVRTFRHWRHESLENEEVKMAEIARRLRGFIENTFSEPRFRLYPASETDGQLPLHEWQKLRKFRSFEAKYLVEASEIGSLGIHSFSVQEAELRLPFSGEEKQDEKNSTFELVVEDSELLNPARLKEENRLKGENRLEITGKFRFKAPPDPRHFPLDSDLELHLRINQAKQRIAAGVLAVTRPDDVRSQKARERRLGFLRPILYLAIGLMFISTLAFLTTEPQGRKTSIFEHAHWPTVFFLASYFWVFCCLAIPRSQGQILGHRLFVIGLAFSIVGESISFNAKWRAAKWLNRRSTHAFISLASVFAYLYPSLPF